MFKIDGTKKLDEYTEFIENKRIVLLVKPMGWERDLCVCNPRLFMDQVVDIQRQQIGVIAVYEDAIAHLCIVEGRVAQQAFLC